MESFKGQWGWECCCSYYPGIWSGPAEIAVPCGHVLVGEARCHIEHDDGTLPMDVVAIAQPAELFLPCCVPAEEAELPSVGCEVQRMHLHANGCCKDGSRDEDHAVMKVHAYRSKA